MKIPSFLRIGRRDQSLSGLENPSNDLIAALTANLDGTTPSGVSMTPLKAFRLAAVYACVRIIAESVASLPMEISRADGKGGRELVPDDERWNLLNEFPNPEQTGMELFENWIAHALLWGRGYLFIVADGTGMARELWPLDPSVTEPRRTKGSNVLYYTTHTADGAPKDIPAERVIPLQAVLGASPTMNARDVLSTAAAAQQYAGRFWQNNARPGGLIELPDSMDEDQMDDFMRRWRAGHEGLSRAQLVGILSGGAQWKEVGIAPGQAQFIETRQFATREIARLYGVPPHRVGEVESNQNRASLEQESIEFITYTLRGWLVRAEQALRTKLFARPSDLATKTYSRFNVAELMRGDMKSRFAAYAIAIQWGFLSRADARRYENLATVAPENQLEEFLVPLNMIPSSKLDQIDVAGSKSKGGGGDQNKDNGGTQPSTGSDGSTPQLNGLALLAELIDDETFTEQLSGLMSQRAAARDGDS